MILEMCGGQKRKEKKKKSYLKQPSKYFIGLKIKKLKEMTLMIR